MWSENKKIDYLVNTLIFLVAINFMHYGQLFLPIICLVLFIDNKFKFKVNSIKLFLLLCLFAVTFFAFSYKLGFYSVMGFCLPMAYYIGTNFRYKNIETYRKIIYILAFGMAMHLILNFFLELTCWYDDLGYMFNKPSHYDIWTNNKIKTTSTSMNYVFIVSCIYYVLRYEKNIIYKVSLTVSFILSSIYMLALGRRTTLLISIVSIVLPIFLENIIFKKQKYFKIVKKSVPLFIILLIVIFAIRFDCFGIKEILTKINLFKRIIEKGIKTDRFEILVSSIKEAPYYLFGGCKLSAEIGNQIHNLWGDIYDYAGIVPFIIMILFTLITIKDVVMYIRRNKTNNEILILSCLMFNILIMMFIEPIMTGASIFLICSLICTSITNQ